MLRNYLKIIWRSIRRSPSYAILNLITLTVGIASCLLILLYVDFELNYDRQHEKADRIVRINTNGIQTRSKKIDVEWQTTTANFAPLAQDKFPEIEQSVRLYRFFDNNPFSFEWENEQTELDVEDIIVADRSLLDVFSIELLSGNPETVLTGPNKIILSEQLAKRIFKDTNPVGKTLSSDLVHGVTGRDSTYLFTVSGVYKDLARNTILYADAYLSAETDPELENYYFNRFHVHSFLLLGQNADRGELAKKLSTVYDEHLDPNIERVMVNATHDLIGLNQIHLSETGGWSYIYIFGAIAFLLLLIAGISYVNLVTAQSSKRSMEIGVRKVMGSSRQQLIVQFLAESLFFTAFALLIGVGLVCWIVPQVNESIGLYLAIEQLWQPQLLLSMFGVLVLLGILGGSYPAFFLSAFEPISVMKGKWSNKIGVRKLLLGVQFAVVIFVLASTGMIYEQLSFLKKKDLGFDQDQMIQIDLLGNAEVEQAPILKEALLKRSGIKSVATCSFTAGLGGMFRRPVSANGTAGQEPQFSSIGYIDYDYLESMQIELLQGRNFSADFPADETESVLVNEAMIQNFGLEEPILGQEIRWGDKNNPNFLRVVGVVKNFHQSSLHSPIESQVFSYRPSSSHLNIKVGGDIATGIAQIKQTLAKVLPAKTFEYRFLDELIQDRYQTDQIRGMLFFAFSLITILIAFLGLFGLASYLAWQRSKEISIRRVFGASTGDAVLLLTKNFLLLVCFATLPAFAAAWYVGNEWMTNFAFQSPVNYGLFVGVLIGTLFLTFITTGFHALRVTQANPAQVLQQD